MCTYCWMQHTSRDLAVPCLERAYTVVAPETRRTSENPSPPRSDHRCTLCCFDDNMATK
jgi:hypothetical protein